MEIENNRNINFLDLTVSHNGNNLKYKIFRKHTYTDTVIHSESHHPVTQKMAVFNSLVNRLLNVPLEREDYLNEVSTIKQIAINNRYKPTICLLYTSRCV